MPEIGINTTKTIAPTTKDNKNPESEFHKGVRVGYYLAMKKVESEHNIEVESKPSIEEIKKHPEYEMEMKKAHKSGFLKGSIAGFESKNKFKTHIHLDGLNKDELRNLIQQENKKVGYNILPYYSTRTKKQLYDFLISKGFKP